MRMEEYAGKISRINLSNGKKKTKVIDNITLRHFWEGNEFAALLFLSRIIVETFFWKKKVSLF